MGKRGYIGATASTVGVGYQPAINVNVSTAPVGIRNRIASQPAVAENILNIQEPAFDENADPDHMCPTNRRIYIGGDFYTGNIDCSPGFSEWDPSTLTPEALKNMHRYWGVSSLSALDGPTIQSFTGKAKVTSDSQSITYITTGGYLYYAYPTPLATPTIYVNGFLNTAWFIYDVPVIENGVNVSYTVYRSNYKQNGSNINLKIDLVLS